MNGMMLIGSGLSAYFSNFFTKMLLCSLNTDMKFCRMEKWNDGVSSFLLWNHFSPALQLERKLNIFFLNHKLIPFHIVLIITIMLEAGLLHSVLLFMSYSCVWHSFETFVFDDRI